MKFRIIFVSCLIFVNCSYIFIVSKNGQPYRRKNLDKSLCPGNCKTSCRECYLEEVVTATRTWDDSKWKARKSELSNSQLCNFGYRVFSSYRQKKENMFEELIQNEFRGDDDVDWRTRMTSAKRLIIEQDDIAHPWGKPVAEAWVSLTSMLGGILIGAALTALYRNKYGSLNSGDSDASGASDVSGDSGDPGDPGDPGEQIAKSRT